MLRNKFVKEIFERRNKKISDIHKDICELTNINPQDVRKSSLLVKIRRMILKSRKLKQRRGSNFQEFERAFFEVPITKSKPDPHPSQSSKATQTTFSVPNIIKSNPLPHSLLPSKESQIAVNVTKIQCNPVPQPSQLSDEDQGAFVVPMIQPSPLQCPCHLPPNVEQHIQIVHSPPNVKQHIQIVHSPPNVEQHIQIVHLQKKVDTLQKEMRIIRQQRQSAKNALKRRDATIEKLKCQPAKYALKRRDVTIEKLKGQLRDQKTILVAKEMEQAKEEKIKMELKRFCVLNTKGVQCNTQRGLINDLQKENDILRNEIEELKNETLKVFDFREEGKGRPYDARIRNLICTLRAHNVGIAHIEPIVNAVLSLINVKVKEFPKKSIIAILSKEMPGNSMMSQLHKEVFQQDKNCDDNRIQSEGNNVMEFMD